MDMASQGFAAKLTKSQAKQITGTLSHILGFPGNKHLSHTFT